MSEWVAVDPAREALNHSRYLLAVATHLRVKTQDSSEKLLAAADTANTIVDAKWLNQLLAGEYQAWAAFLLDCQEHHKMAFDRARGLAPWPIELRIHKLRFGWGDDDTFWKPIFNKLGYATGGCHGYLSGTDTYAILYEERLTLEQIVQRCIWLGFRISGRRGETPEPTSRG